MIVSRAFLAALTLGSDHRRVVPLRCWCWAGRSIGRGVRRHAWGQRAVRGRRPGGAFRCWLPVAASRLPGGARTQARILAAGESCTRSSQPARGCVRLYANFIDRGFDRVVPSWCWLSPPRSWAMLWRDRRSLAVDLCAMGPSGFPFFSRTRLHPYAWPLLPRWFLAVRGFTLVSLFAVPWWPPSFRLPALQNRSPWPWRTARKRADRARAQAIRAG